MLIEAASVSKSKDGTLKEGVCAEAFVRVFKRTQRPWGGAYVWRGRGDDLHCDTVPVQLPGERRVIMPKTTSVRDPSN